MKIHQRVGEIEAASSADEMVRYKIGRCHRLTGDRAGHCAVDLVQPYRLIFTERFVGDEETVIIEMVDYH